MKMLGARSSEEVYNPSETSEIPEDSGSSDLEPEKDEISF
jgi:hypothetical protein